MRHYLAALLRRLADRLEPPMKYTMRAHIKDTNGALTNRMPAQIAQRLKELDWAKYEK